MLGILLVNNTKTEGGFFEALMEDTVEGGGVLRVERLLNGLILHLQVGIESKVKVGKIGLPSFVIFAFFKSLGDLLINNPLVSQKLKKRKRLVDLSVKLLELGRIQYDFKSRVCGDPVVMDDLKVHDKLEEGPVHKHVVPPRRFLAIGSHTGELPGLTVPDVRMRPKINPILIFEHLNNRWHISVIGIEINGQGLGPIRIGLFFLAEGQDSLVGASCLGFATVPARKAIKVKHRSNQ